MEITMPLHLSQKLARAKSLLKRDAAMRGAEALMSGLEAYEPRNLTGKVRFEVEVLIQECVAELNRQSEVRNLLESLAKNKKATVPYTPGHEDRLMAMLQLVHKALSNEKEKRKREAEEALLNRKMFLEQKGLGYLRGGDLSRGKATLRVLAEEFGHEPGLLIQVGEWMLEQNLYFEAMEILEKAIENFPKESKAYSLAAEGYATLREFEKAEAVYLRAIKEFGRHPRTLLHLARVYQAQSKREEAFHFAREAWDKDNSLTEAKEIVDKNI